MAQGQMATQLGNLEEQKIIQYLETLGYRAIDKQGRSKSLAWVRSGRDIADWCRNYAGIDAVFFKAHPTINNIYGVEWKVDFTVWHREIWPVGLFIEVKSQNISGSADSKIPYVVFSLKKLRRPTGLIMLGNGYCKGLIPWIQSQEDDRFILWRNPVKMREYVKTGKVIHSSPAPRAMVVKAQNELEL